MLPAFIGQIYAISISVGYGPTVFGRNLARQLQERESRETELYEQIGRLKMKLEWLKKAGAIGSSQRFPAERSDKASQIRALGN